jgi:hypothetical protein
MVPVRILPPSATVGQHDWAVQILLDSGRGARGSTGRATEAPYAVSVATSTERFIHEHTPGHRRPSVCQDRRPVSMPQFQPRTNNRRAKPPAMEESIPHAVVCAAGCRAPGHTRLTPYPRSVQRRTEPGGIVADIAYRTFHSAPQAQRSEEPRRCSSLRSTPAVRCATALSATVPGGRELELGGQNCSGEAAADTFPQERRQWRPRSYPRGCR